MLQNLVKKAEKHGWIAGNTSVSDLPKAELSLMCGLQPVEKPRFFLKRPAFLLKKKIPDNWDWRTRDKVSPIRSQGSCGSCAAFSICGAMESQKLISSSSGSKFKFNADADANDENKKGIDRKSLSDDLSEAHLFFCSSHRCDTGSDFASLFSFAKDTGVTKEEFFPYASDTFNTCSVKDGFDDSDNLTFLDGYTELNGALTIKKSIFNNGPVVVGMKVYDDFFYYTGGIYRHVWGGLAGYHAVLLIGYGVLETKCCFGLGILKKKKKFFIVKNSWTDDWGEKGFFKIAVGECGIGKLGVYQLFLKS